MSYRLKKESPEFSAVDGPMEGRKFRHGETYEAVPEGDKGRFEEAQPPRPSGTPPYQGGEEKKEKKIKTEGGVE